MTWLNTFNKQNKLAIGVASFLFLGGIGNLIYSNTGTKYNVIEYCFDPLRPASSTKKYCTDELKFIVPEGFYEQEKYAPANPRFQVQATYNISNKLRRLRRIPATNPNAENYSIASLLLFILATLLLKQRSKRYKYEFAAFYEELKTDLNQTINTNEQKREIHSTATVIETEYIKDGIKLEDAVQRHQDKSEGQREFESQQIENSNQISELQLQLQVAQIKQQLAKIEAETNKLLNVKDTHKPSIETVEKIDYETLCPGKVGELEFYDWRDLLDDAVGIFIVGNSGSGKTSVASWIAGWLTKDKPAQMLALDPHANKNPLWQELGIHVYSEIPKIEYQLVLLLNELDLRQSPGYDGDEEEIIFFADELNACLKRFEDSELIGNALTRLGSEGRKYGMTMIALNQSSNCNSLGIDVKMRSNFLIIMLNAAARHKADTWKKEDTRRKHVEETAYTCVVDGSVREMVAVHPTHNSYKIYKKKGNKPIGLLPINQLPLTIELADKLPEKEPKEKDWYDSFIELKEQLGRVPDIEEIQQTWLEVMKVPCDVKQAEAVQESLKENDLP